MSNKVQRSFAGGEQAPSLWARTDQLKYATGLRTLRNFVVQRHGGVANRPGWRFIGATKDPASAVVLFPFVFNDEQTYVLEFGDHYLRIVREGGYVLDGLGAVYEITTPYAAGDLSALGYVQSADTLTLVHPSYPPHDLQRTGHAAWSFAPIVFGPSVGGVTSLSASGGTAGDDTWWAVTAIDGETQEEGLPVTVKLATKIPASGSAVQLAWLPASGAIRYNVYRSTDGLTFGFVGTSGGTPLPATDTTWTTATSQANATTENQWESDTGQARITVVSAAVDKARDRIYRVKGTIKVTGADLTDGYIQGSGQVFYSRNGEARQNGGQAPLVRAYADAFGSVDSGAIPFTAYVEVPDDGYTSLAIDIVADVWFTRSNSDPTLGAFCEIVGTQVEWTKGAVGFSDVGQAPDFTSAPPAQRSVFQGEGRYPSAVGYFQQRRLFGNTTLEPEKVWGSRVGSYTSFPTSTPMQDDDSVAFSLASREVNAVRHLVDLDGLYVFTTGGIANVEGGQDGIITPTTINPRRKAPYGAAALPPIAIGAGALFVEARQSLVRDFRPDAPEDQRSRDLTIFAAHLFDRYTVVDWAFAKNPHSVIWAVRSDGVLLGLTYLPEHEVWGWHRHDTDGAVERVCVVPEGSEDAVYLVVRRTVNGEAVRYVERMASRQFADVADAVFMDAALSYDGWNASDTTMALSGGVVWDESEVLTITASAATFTAGDVGNAVFFRDATGRVLRVTIEGYTSATVVTGRADRAVPVELQDTATATWARAVDELAGLEHLEGKAVSILADGFVVASPNNATYPVLTVASGKVTLDQPYAKVHVGLPYISDLETLDIDNAQGPSVKSQKMLVNKVGLYVERSRGIFVGGKVPDGDDPLQGLDEFKAREDEPLDEPIALKTDYVEVAIANEWSRHGRICVRQVDPLPLTILSVTPQGFTPQTN